MASQWSQRKEEATAEVTEIVPSGQSMPISAVKTELRSRMGLSAKNALKAIYLAYIDGLVTVDGGWGDSAMVGGV